MYNDHESIDFLCSDSSKHGASDSPSSAKMAAALMSGTSMAGKWFDSGICVDSLSSASSILSSTSGSIRSTEPLEFDLLPPPPETDPQDARLIQQLRNESLHTFLPDTDGDT
jgi:hypothetical protein